MWPILVYYKYNHFVCTLNALYNFFFWHFALCKLLRIGKRNENENNVTMQIVQTHVLDRFHGIRGAVSVEQL